MSPFEQDEQDEKPEEYRLPTSGRPGDPDCLDIYDEPLPEDFSSPPLVRSGPLERPSGLQNAAPAVSMYILFYAASILYWHYPQGDLLWASRHAVFAEHQYWRLLTALFVHADLGHILANTLLFLVFGFFLRAHFGLLAFPALSLTIGTACHGLTLLFYEPQVRLAGSSGMIYGMTSLWLVLYIRFEAVLRPRIRLLHAAGFTLALMVPTTFNPETSYLSHAIGFALGLICGTTLAFLVRPREPEDFGVARGGSDIPDSFGARPGNPR